MAYYADERLSDLSIPASHDEAGTKPYCAAVSGTD
jgi:hypothetical protein